MVVVGALIVVDGRALAALRRTPPGWEFPGGKVEPGEDPARAVERECAEELGVTVRALREVAGAEDGTVALRLWAVDLLDGIPAPLEHVELRWVDEAGLEALGWLPVDRALLPHVRAHLAAPR
jgi:8-oxo-dGTP diphosphatase